MDRLDEHGGVRQGRRPRLVRGRGGRARSLRADGRQTCPLSRRAARRAPHQPHHAPPEPDRFRARLLRALPRGARRGRSRRRARRRRAVRAARQAARHHAGACSAGTASRPCCCKLARQYPMLELDLSFSDRDRRPRRGWLRPCHPDRRSRRQGRPDRAPRRAPAHGGLRARRPISQRHGKPRRIDDLADASGDHLSPLGPASGRGCFRARASPRRRSCRQAGCGSTISMPSPTPRSHGMGLAWLPCWLVRERIRRRRAGRRCCRTSREYLYDCHALWPRRPGCRPRFAPPWTHWRPPCRSS